MCMYVENTKAVMELIETVDKREEEDQFKRQVENMRWSTPM